MWRQVLSQSPTSVPNDAASVKQADKYLANWKTLGMLLHSGRSLSGHERNVCFLNTGQTRFANVSASTGFDIDADSRALAVMDWDGDGDQDVWLTNRTEPRIRYLQNGYSQSDTPRNNFVAVKLRGVTCNRDAIGAQVIVQLSSEEKPLVKTLSAGEGFLSQSSKWMHFGLGTAESIRHVEVKWPGGQAQSFSGMLPGRRYILTQGKKQPEVWRTSSQIANEKPNQSETAETLQRVAAARRIPMPRIDYIRFDGSESVVFRPGSPLLLNLWASWCQPCIAELSAWEKGADAFRKRNVRIVALNVDHANEVVGPQQRQAVADLSDRLGLRFEGGFINGENIELIEIVAQSLLLMQRPLPIPMTLLVDKNGRLAALYKGRVSVERLLTDIDLLDHRQDDPRDGAIPFAGRWLTEPFPLNPFDIPDRLVGRKRGDAAYRYLKEYVPNVNNGKRDAFHEFGVSNEKVAAILNETARQILPNGKATGAIELLEHATLYRPTDWNLHVRLAQLLIAEKRSADAIQVSQRMAKLRPNHPLAQNNIAWVLATAGDASIRDSKRALEIAEQVCRTTQYQEPSALDTLAVAYASDGRFEDAVRVAKKAIELCRELKIEPLAKTIGERLQLFEAGKPFK